MKINRTKMGILVSKDALIVTRINLKKYDDVSQKESFNSNKTSFKQI